MSLIKRGNIYWIDLMHRGRRVRRSTQSTDKEAAQQQHDELKARLWRQRLISPETWHDAQRAWLLHEERDDADKDRLRKFNRLFADRPLSQMTTAAIQTALTGFTPGTYNRYLNVILAILNFARKKRWIEAVPELERRTPPAGRLRWLEAEEWETLQTTLPAHLLPAARFSVATGVRQSNATFLTWDQVNLRGRVAWIHADQAKGKAPIRVPLWDDAMAVLQGQIEARDARIAAMQAKHGPLNAVQKAREQWVFPYRGKPLAKIRGAWQRALERAGLGYFEKIPAKRLKRGYRLIWHSDVTWHTLRHTWASWHVMNGTSLLELKELGAWKTLAMVQVYAHLAPERLADRAGNAKPVSLRHSQSSQGEKKIA